MGRLGIGAFAALLDFCARSRKRRGQPKEQLLFGGGGHRSATRRDSSEEPRFRTAIDPESGLSATIGARRQRRSCKWTTLRKASRVDWSFGRRKNASGRSAGHRTLCHNRGRGDRGAGQFAPATCAARKRAVSVRCWGAVQVHLPPKRGARCASRSQVAPMPGRCAARYSLRKSRERRKAERALLAQRSSAFERENLVRYRNRSASRMGDRSARARHRSSRAKAAIDRGTRRCLRRCRAGFCRSGAR